MKRRDLWGLTRIRLKEAKVLLKAGCHEGAFYLAGYAVECALKACIAKRTERYEFPDKQAALECHTHDLKALMKAARLEALHTQHMAADPAFGAHWQTVLSWKEVSRYQRPTVVMATALVTAVSDSKHGVLRWLRLHW